MLKKIIEIIRWNQDKVVKHLMLGMLVVVWLGKFTQDFWWLIIAAALIGIFCEFVVEQALGTKGKAMDVVKTTIGGILGYILFFVI